MMDGSGLFFGGGFMWIFWIILLVIIVMIAKGLLSNPPGSAPPTNESPMDILKRRYAQGEIDEEEFERRKKGLEER